MKKQLVATMAFAVAFPVLAAMLAGASCTATTDHGRQAFSI